MAFVEIDNAGFNRIYVETGPFLANGITSSIEVRIAYGEFMRIARVLYEEGIRVGQTANPDKLPTLEMLQPSIQTFVLKSTDDLVYGHSFDDPQEAMLFKLANGGAV